MAQKVTQQLISDLDGTDADETVEFGLDGVDYEIDLTADQAAKFRQQLGPITAKARRTGGRLRRGNKAGAKKTDGTPDAGDVRAWAIKMNLGVSERGRIPQSIIDQYKEHHAASNGSRRPTKATASPSTPFLNPEPTTVGASSAARPVAKKTTTARPTARKKATKKAAANRG